MPKKSEWRQSCDIAEKLGPECATVIESLGQEKYDQLRQIVRQRFEGHGALDKTEAEWVIAVWRYQTAVSGRDLSELEQDKLLRLEFVLRWLQDRLTASVQVLLVSPFVAEDTDPLFKELLEAKKILEAGRRELLRPGKPQVQLATELVADCTRLLDRLVEILRRVREETITDKERREQISSVKSMLESIGKEINATETELRIKASKEEQSVSEYIGAILDKVERYMKANPAYFTWVCATCGWEGLLCKRVPMEGRLTNALSPHWIWKCPSCGSVLAGGAKHPLFEGQILFSRRAWELVCRGELSLAGMAHILHTSPEWIVYVTQRIFKETMPPHVKEEWDRYEEKVRVQAKYDLEMQGTLPDGEELGC